MSLRFGWDEDKGASNAAKHNVAFEEASTVFSDPLATIFDDEAHSSEEIREIIVGHSAADRLLLVAFTEREGFIRIISTRQAIRQERRDYERNTRR